MTRLKEARELIYSPEEQVPIILSLQRPRIQRWPIMIRLLTSFTWSISSTPQRLLALRQLAASSPAAPRWLRIASCGSKAVWIPSFTPTHRAWPESGVGGYGDCFDQCRRKHADECRLFSLLVSALLAEATIKENALAVQFIFRKVLRLSWSNLRLLGRQTQWVYFFSAGTTLPTGDAIGMAWSCSSAKS